MLFIKGVTYIYILLYNSTNAATTFSFRPQFLENFNLFFNFNDYICKYIIYYYYCH